MLWFILSVDKTFERQTMTEDIAMTDRPASDAPLSPRPSARAQARAAAKARRLTESQRREACFDCFASGWTPHEIARVLKVSVASVRRWIDRAIDERRLNAPDRYAHVQVARLSKMLCALNSQLERGDTRAVPPMLKVVAALDRYHGFHTQYERLVLPAFEPASAAATEARLPLALTHAPAEAEPAEVADIA